MQKILIIGGSGSLGSQLNSHIQKLDGFNITTTVRTDKTTIGSWLYKKVGVIENFDLLKITDEEIIKILKKVSPDVIINCTAIIDWQNSLPSETIYVNSYMPHKLYEICSKILKDFYFITISTDAVFDGSKGPYTESDTPSPLNFYGLSKLAGEVSGKNALSIRTSHYGPHTNNPKSKKGIFNWFTTTNAKSVEGYKNYYFSGLSTKHLSEIITNLIQRKKKVTGILHISSSSISKLELLKEMNKLTKKKKDIVEMDEPKIDLSLISERNVELNIDNQETMIKNLMKGINTKS